MFQLRTIAVVSCPDSQYFFLTKLKNHRVDISYYRPDPIAKKKKIIIKKKSTKKKAIVNNFGSCTFF